jgi:hypothetical protein
MALDTYSGLLASVAAWAHRSDLAAVIPDMVYMVESQLNRDLRVRQMETRVTTTTADEYLTLPTDHVEIRRIQRNGDPDFNLEYLTPQQLVHRGTETGEPYYYTLVSGQIQLWPTPGQSYTYEIDYYAALNPIVTAGTNWLLQDYPDVYLFGTLAQVANYTGNDGGLARWKPQYDEAIGKLLRYDKRERWAGTPLQVRADVCVD